jgi:hypothetical protein
VNSTTASACFSRSMSSGTCAIVCNARE